MRACVRVRARACVRQRVKTTKCVFASSRGSNIFLNDYYQVECVYVCARSRCTVLLFGAAPALCVAAAAAAAGERGEATRKPFESWWRGFSLEDMSSFLIRRTFAVILS